MDYVTTKYRVYENNTIGLGHEKEYEKRKKDVYKNCQEKKAILAIVKKYKGNNSEEYRYCKRVADVFFIRRKAMAGKNVTLAIKALVKSFGLSRLYESIMMDLITIIR